MRKTYQTYAPFVGPAYSSAVATFPRGHSSNALWRRHRRELRRAGGVNISTGAVTWQQDPVDLRGLPAISRGWSGGAIRGTRPGDDLR